MSLLPLTQVDAFFVAYQARHQVAMQLGAEYRLRGAVPTDVLQQALEVLVQEWPQLGQRLRRRWLGLAWAGPSRVDEILSVQAPAKLPEWRNAFIDPFQTSPLRVLWAPEGDEGGTLAIRAHHSVADGEALYGVTQRLLMLVSAGRAGLPLTPRESPGGQHGAYLRAKRLIKKRKLGPMWRYVRWLVRESRANRCAHLALRETAPGHVSLCLKQVSGPSYEALRQRAHTLGVAPSLLVGAAWARAIAGWNSARGEDDCHPVSLELPLSVRRGPARALLGNLVSPLILLRAPGAGLSATALDFHRQFRQGVRDRAHLAMPIFTSLGRFLPWSLFRRLAANTTWSGFASSHFTWLRDELDVFGTVVRQSHGALSLEEMRILTPVCLRMGAGVCAMPFEDRLDLHVSYRETAFQQAEAEQLADILVNELQA